MSNIQIEGKNPVLEALRSRRQPEKIYILASLKNDARIDEILSFVKGLRTPF